MSWRYVENETLVLQVQVQARNGADTVLGVHGERLRIRVGAPPIESRANERLLNFLAREFGVPKSQVTLRSGQSSKFKCVAIVAPRRQPEWYAKLTSINSIESNVDSD
jgi:hypothetical protein